MARPKVDSRLQNIEKDIAEVKEMMKNGNNQTKNQNEEFDMRVCDETKAEMEAEDA